MGLLVVKGGDVKATELMYPGGLAKD
jgi:hypothetical protein